MKFTFFVTQRCNLACDYCYIRKRAARMGEGVAKKAVDFAFGQASETEELDFGFFGGEPLLEFGILQGLTHLVERHPLFSARRVTLSVVTNGTVFSPQIANFLLDHNINLCVSCDGPPSVHDLHRRFPSGRGSSVRVEATIRKAIALGVPPLVNAVYAPNTVRFLPETVEYFSSLGLRRIYLNPDFSAAWTKEDIRPLREAYASVGTFYRERYREGDRHFISLIDGKIAVILRGGYKPMERCRMGSGEFAFTPEGRIYPCERLVGDGIAEDHCIGDLDVGVSFEKLCSHKKEGAEINPPCLSCGLRDFCMNWCGCSNYFGSGYYNRVSPFLCASEQISIETAFEVLQSLEKELGPSFYDHLDGTCLQRAMAPE